MKYKLRNYAAIAAFVLASSIMMQKVMAETDVYSVKRGDTLWEISKKYKVDLSNVIETNPQFEDPDLIFPNQKVFVPLTEYDPNSPNNTNTTDNTNTTNTTNTTSGTTGGPQTDKAGSTPQSAEKGNMPSLSASTPTDASLEQQVVDLVNKERSTRSLKPLSLSSNVASVARYKSEDMIKKNYFSHESPTYGSPFQMLTNFGVKYSSAGENIAKGQKNASAVVNAWMNSEGHRKNILSSSFTEIGVGFAKDSGGTTYWTQIFIRP